MAKPTQSRNASRLHKTASKSATAIRKGQESAEASLQVVRKRLALGIEALANPAQADHVEFSKMLPEKLTALSSSSLIFSEKSTQLWFQLMRHATQEMARAASHTQAMMTMTNPVSAITAQASYVAETAERAFSTSLLLSSMGASLVEATGAPSHRAVMANAKRLK